MYDKILVPLDGSKRAEAILPYVQELALEHGSRVLFLQVMTAEPSTAAVVMYHLDVDLQIAEMKQRFREAEQYLTAHKNNFCNTGIDTEALLKYGPIVDTIITVANEFDVDLIALASHGRTGLGHVFYGSVAAGVLNRAERPVLIVRSRVLD